MDSLFSYQRNSLDVDFFSGKRPELRQDIGRIIRQRHLRKRLFSSPVILPAITFVLLPLAPVLWFLDRRYTCPASRFAQAE